MSSTNNNCSLWSVSRVACTLIDGERKCKKMDRLFRKCSGRPEEEFTLDSNGNEVWAVAQDMAFPFSDFPTRPDLPTKRKDRDRSYAEYRAREQ